MTQQDWQGLAAALPGLLSLDTPPVAITFSEVRPTGIPLYEGAMPEPMPDGRTGKVPAGCVFWVKATERTFTTLPADHGNCSVGSLTHGLKTMQEVAGNEDVAASVGCMLSRVRTGLPNSQMTCAIPARRLAEVVARLRATCAADTAVAAYAAEDSRRFT